MKDSPPWRGGRTMCGLLFLCHPSGVVENAERFPEVSLCSTPGYFLAPLRGA